MAKNQKSQIFILLTINFFIINAKSINNKKVVDHKRDQFIF